MVGVAVVAVATATVALLVFYLSLRLRKRERHTLARIGASRVQVQALMATEGLTLEFSEDAIDRIAEIAWQVNEQTENIGARRLHTVMERLLESLSFDASDIASAEKDRVSIDAAYVDEHLEELAGDADLSRFIL